jgi:hypothetical protein
MTVILQRHLPVIIIVSAGIPWLQDCSMVCVASSNGLFCIGYVRICQEKKCFYHLGAGILSLSVGFTDQSKQRRFVDWSVGCPVELFQEAMVAVMGILRWAMSSWSF